MVVTLTRSFFVRMKKVWFVFSGLLWICGECVYAQNWTPADSTRLQRLLKSEDEIRLNSSALKELNRLFVGEQKVVTDKSWLQADETLPKVKYEGNVPTQGYTLHPYTPSTKYDWDPVYATRLKISKNSWRGKWWDNYRATDLKYVYNESGKKNEGLKMWHGIYIENGVIKGDFATLLTQYFTKDYWKFQDKRNRVRTREVLKGYDAYLPLDTLFTRKFVAGYPAPNR